jgi:hypothetical protein
MKKIILLWLFFVIILLSGCSKWPELSIHKIDNYTYNQKTILDSDEYNEIWNLTNSGGQEERYRVEDKKIGIRLDYLHMYYSGEQSNIQIYRTTWINYEQEFLYAWWWNLGVIESTQFIVNELDFLNVIKQSDEKFEIDWCALKIWTNHKTISQLFTGERYLTAGYKDYFPISEDLIWKCPYANSMLTFPTFVFDKKSPKRILVIVDTDGRNGLSYWKGMGTLRW